MAECIPRSDSRASKSVLPGDSASQRSSSGFCGVSQVSVNPYNFDVSRCVFTADDYLKVVDTVGVQEASRLLTFMESQLRLVDRCASVQCGAMRSASSIRSGSNVSPISSALGGSNGLVGSRAISIRNMKSWRKKVPDGLCYSKVFKFAAAQQHTSVLGEWPCAASLLGVPASAFQGLDELERFKLVGDSDRVHVKAGGQDGSSFLASMAKLAASMRCPVGTFGAVLKADGRRFGSPAVMSGRTVIGGAGNSHNIRRRLEGFVGAVGLGAEHDLYLASATSGVHESSDKNELRSLESVGDAALTLAVSDRCRRFGCSAQQYQAARSLCTNNSSLSALLARSFDTADFAAPAGVSFSTGKVGAGVLEALIGIVYIHLGMSAVDKFCDSVGIFDLVYSAGFSVRDL